MALIGTSAEPGGVARIFFDLQMFGSSADDIPRITLAIERAFETTRSDAIPGDGEGGSRWRQTDETSAADG